MSGLDVTEIDDWNALEGEREDWNRLLAESAGDTLFLRQEWLSLWWKHFGADRRLAVVLARRDGRPAAALPLMEDDDFQSGLRVPVLRSTTNAHSFRFNGLCAPGDDAALRAIWSHLRARRRSWQAIILEEVPEDAPVLEPLLDAARRDGHPVGTWRGAEVPYLATEGTWPAYLDSLSRNMRANLRKKSRRLRERGEVVYRCISAPGDVEDALEAGLGLEGSGWKERAGSAILSNPTLTRFYTEWARAAAARGWLRLSLLEVAGVHAAFDFSTQYAGRYFDLKMGYDPAWGQYSVGQLLKAEILRRCFEGDTREYDFLGPMMRAKDDWAPQRRAHSWHFIFAASPLGRYLHFLKFRVKPALKRALGR